MLKVMYSLVQKEKRKIVAHLSSIVHYPHAPPRKHFSLSHLGKERDPPPASSPPIFLSRTRFFNDSPALTYTCKKYIHTEKNLHSSMHHGKIMTLGKSKQGIRFHLSSMFWNTLRQGSEKPAPLHCCGCFSFKAFTELMPLVLLSFHHCP